MKTIYGLFLLLLFFVPTNGQDTDLQLDSAHLKFWDESAAAWALIGRQQYIYDQNGYLGSTIVYFGNETGKSIPTGKTEYDYDQNGNRIRETEYSNEGVPEAWIPTEKREYFLNTLGNDTLELSYDWNPNTSIWIIEGRNEFLYDDLGNQIQILKFRIEGPGQPWISQWKFEYQYDANVIVETTYRWDESGEVWLPSEKITETVDDEGNVILQTHEYWDDVLADWIIQGQEKNETVVTEFKKQVTTYNWEQSSGQWIPSIRFIYFYSTQSTQVEFRQLTEWIVFPNPASAYIQIKGEQILEPAMVELWDIQGHRVLNQPLNSLESVAIGHLPKGFYAYRILVNGRMYGGKLVIE